MPTTTHLTYVLTEVIIFVLLWSSINKNIYRTITDCDLYLNPTGFEIAFEPIGQPKCLMYNCPNIRWFTVIQTHCTSTVIINSPNINKAILSEQSAPNHIHNVERCAKGGVCLSKMPRLTCERTTLLRRKSLLKWLMEHSNVCGGVGVVWRARQPAKQR